MNVCVNMFLDLCSFSSGADAHAYILAFSIADNTYTNPSPYNSNTHQPAELSKPNRAWHNIYANTFPNTCTNMCMSRRMDMYIGRV